MLSAKLDVARNKAATIHFLGAQSLAASLDESCDLRSCDPVFTTTCFDHCVCVTMELFL